MAEKSTDVQKTETVTGTVASRPMDKFKAYAEQRAQLETDNMRNELEASQMDRILSAQTEEELEAAMSIESLPGLNDIENGTILIFHGYHMVKSNRDDFKSTLGVYAVIDVEDRSGRRFQVNTGVTRIIGFLRAAEVQGLFPCSRIVVKQLAGSGEMITLKRI